jgi:uncharacterized protein YggU (UPF0235/DUF167 family)
VPRRAVTLVSGATSRDKLVAITRPPARLPGLLARRRLG